MRTVPFKSILNWLARRMLGSEANLTQEFAGAYVDMINSAVRDGWEREFWPEWTVIEQRFYRPAWAAGTYPAGTELSHSGTYWRALSSTATEPSAAAAAWQECGLAGALPLDPYLALTSAGQLTIGTPRTLTQDDPRSHAGARELAFHLSRQGVQVQASARDYPSVWLEYRLPPPVFTAEVWVNFGSYSEARGYLPASRVYEPESGECWVATSADSTARPGLLNDPGSSAQWQLVEFPFVLAEFVKLAAYDEALRDDGQHDKASVQHDFAEDALATEWTKAESQIGAVRTFHVLSRKPPGNPFSLCA